jgi:hypothetical protein
MAVLATEGRAVHGRDIVRQVLTGVLVAAAGAGG